MADVVLAALDREALALLAALVEFLVHRAGKAVLHILQQHAILRALRAGERGLDRAELEFHDIGEDRIGRRLGAVEPLRLRVGLHQRDALALARGLGQIVDGVVIDREESAGRAILRRHVADGGAVLDGQVVEAGAEELDELADHAALAQHLRDGENEIGRGHAFLQLAVQAEADHLGEHHRVRLAEHRGLGFDAADAPAEHRETVHHRGVRVGADQRVGIGDLRDHDLAVGLDLLLLGAGPDGLRQVLEIDLVTNTGSGRHDAEIIERFLRPLEERVALLVLRVLFGHVLLEGRRRSEEVHDHRVIDHEIDWHQRIDLGGIAAELLHRIAHRREIDDGRHAGEVLHQHARRAKRDLAVRGLGLEPLRKALDVLLGDGPAILIAQKIFQEHLQREGEARNSAQPMLLGLGKAVIHIGLGPDGEGPGAFETVERGHGRFFHPTGRAGGAERASR